MPALSRREDECGGSWPPPMRRHRQSPRHRAARATTLSMRRRPIADGPPKAAREPSGLPTRAAARSSSRSAVGLRWASTVSQGENSDREGDWTHISRCRSRPVSPTQPRESAELWRNWPGTRPAEADLPNNHGLCLRPDLRSRAPLPGPVRPRRTRVAHRSRARLEPSLAHPAHRRMPPQLRRATPRLRHTPAHLRPVRHAQRDTRAPLRLSILRARSACGARARTTSSR